MCRCDSRYVSQTSQRLQDKINQHIPRCIRSDKRPTKNLPNRECKITCTPSVSCDSAIVLHLLGNEECAKHFNDAQFFLTISLLRQTSLSDQALRPVSLLRRLRHLHPLSQGSPHYRLAFTNHDHLGAPHVTLAAFALSRLVRIL